MKYQGALVTFLFVVPFFVFADTQSFSRALFLGVRGSDVRELQKILNADSDTRISEAGAGSPGYETDYFGFATKRALIKFQEKYREEVLVPAGLTSGTGVLGAKTRAKILSLKSSSGATGTHPVPKGDVIVMFPSQYSGRPGTMITISGVGFTKADNTIYFGNEHAVVKAASMSGQEITFKVPAIPKGNYSLFVKNARGESNKDSFFVVTDGVTPEPVVENISPSRATRGATVVVTGSGFSATENTVRAGVSILDHVSSADGHSLSFVVPMSTLTATTSSTKKIVVPLWVYVVNEDGVSNGKSFDLEI